MEKKVKSNEITVKVVKVILLILPTLYLGGAFISTIDWWYSMNFESNSLTSYVENEEYVALFLSIACFLQIILLYTLAFYHKINKKWLKHFNIAIAILGFISLITALIIDYNLYVNEYAGDFAMLIMIGFLFYLAIIPAILIHIYDKRKLTTK